MSKHLERDLDLLRKSLLEVGTKVEAAAQTSIRALSERRADLAEAVIGRDNEIDRMEVLLEEECLKVLALHQPVASDLRFVIGVMKVNNDLERMGDQAVNIAERAIFLAEREPLGFPPDFHRMMDAVQKMVSSALDAHVNLDTGLARSVGRMDDEVDDIHRAMFDTLQQRMQEDPATVERAVAYLSASKELERIADLATNIAEDAVFMVEGEVVRHRGSEQPDI
ncbi:MAG TPA: phosphate signaling complex protein PhoU [Gemmatimonadales bacterium]|jgi:phosphate transport system protein